MSRLLLSCFVVAGFGVASASAHHTVPGRSHAVATVTIAQQVLADGKLLAPGTYEIWILDERPDVKAGAPSEAQRIVEFVQNGKPVATEIAEVFPHSERPVGTSGPAMSKARVEMLKGGEFVRVAVNDARARYLIHLPTGTRPVQP